MYNQLTGLVLPKNKNPCIGQELGIFKGNGISIFRSKTNIGISKRYVYSVLGTPKSGIQVMIKDNIAVITNAYTVPKWQKKGLACLLLEKIYTDHKDAVFSDDRSKAGKALVSKWERIKKFC